MFIAANFRIFIRQGNKGNEMRERDTMVKEKEDDMVWKEDGE